MRILKEGKDIEYKGVCERCGTEFAYFKKDTRNVLKPFLACPLCREEMYVTFEVLSDKEEKALKED